jgi:hypothetical protein
MDTRAGEAAHAYVGSLVFSVSHVIVKDVPNAVTAHWKINGPSRTWISRTVLPYAGR